eukprot:TRINITY_DN596_c1_g2_i1.p1 TRINITY_DN596_c1_g2~~TRINITY_DN596_c1_g2_i1.p1  ORF type:complete len:146 (-),score=42.95 TRINITY_DN596_c1_g2_i1:123-560(-)
MKLFTFFCLFCSLLLLLHFSNATNYGSVQNVKVISCYDGDTCTLNIAGWPPIVGKEISVRLLGIDTPEIQGSCAKERQLAISARDFLVRRSVNATSVELRNLQRDKYFRLLADMFVNGRNMSRALITEGLAVAYDGGTKTKNWCL